MQQAMNVTLAGQENDTGKTSTADLILRCYDALISDFREGRSALARSDEATLMDRVRHAQDLVTELVLGLDYERGGGVAQNLGRIYNFLLKELVTVDGVRSDRVLNDLERIVEELREAWARVVEKETLH